MVVVGLTIAAGLAIWLRGRGTTDKPADATANAVQKPAPPTAPTPRRGGPEADTAAPISVMIDDDPKGTLRLEGQVLADGDKPAAGVTVVLGSNPPRTAISEEDGSFAFDDLVGRPYTLVARGAGGIAGPVTANEQGEFELGFESSPTVSGERSGWELVLTAEGFEKERISVGKVKEV